MTARRVLVLVLPEVNVLDLSGPVQVLAVSNNHGADYEIRYVADDECVVSAQGLALARLEALPPVREGDLVMIPGPRLTGRTAGDRIVSETVLSWVREAYAAGARLASICTGAVVLGDAGLLDGRRCTSHWSVIESMKARYPLARVEADVLFTHDGRVSTSAGIASGIDLALSLVERDHGARLAAAVARYLVVYVRRNGDASPISPFLDRRDHLNPAVHRTQEVLAQDLATPRSLSDLAAGVHLSMRGLTKAFVAATGTTPLRYQQELRLSHAEELLATTSRSITEVARSCGYADPRQFRRVFVARHGVSPAAYRRGHAT